ncbi:MAG: hypothetical protein JNK82_26305 [Myxococcaceae bacterium]|nr:hypothetical protein [Myxococcaceae bacterium]
MRRGARLAWVLVFVGCECAQVEPLARYACDENGQCLSGERCVGGFCERVDGGAAGGSGGGGDTAGGGRAGGGVAGGGSAGGAPFDAGCAGRPDPVDALGLDENCDGVDGVAAEAVFIDPLHGTVNGEGTRAYPVSSFSSGLVKIGPAGKVRFFVAEGTLTETETVRLGAYSVHGGYSRTEDGGWVRSRLRLSGCGDGGRPILYGAPVAMRCDPGDASVTIESLCIVAADADAGASIGLAIVGGGDRTVLGELDVTAGVGADGPDGADGDAGADGEPGEPGQRGGPSVDRVAGGDGGRATCGLSNGGNGGAGRDSASGLPGQSAEGARGGVEGALVTGSCTSSCTCGTVTRAGGDGAPGDAGVDGDAGRAGHGIGAVTAALLWQPVSGTPGTAGTRGRPGAGGGGAGWYRLDSTGVTGASGGGGGAPGCPGAGGGAGMSGGASIGLLLLNAKPTLVGDVSLTARNGGNGGSAGVGGRGGEGGMGGDGGPGFEMWCNGGDIALDGGAALGQQPLPGPLGTRGGAGGQGGRGGNGGNAGSGAGGPSVAIFCADGGYTGIPTRRDVGSGGMGAMGADGGLVAQQYACTM